MTTQTTTQNTQASTVDTTGLAPINENALSSTIAAKLFLLTDDAMQSTIMAFAVTDAVSLVRSTGMEDAFLEFALEAATEAKLSTVHVQPGPLATDLAEKKLAHKEQGGYYMPTKEELAAVQAEKGSRQQT